MKKHLLPALAVALLPLMVSAQTLTLEEAIGRALKENNQLKAAHFAKKQAQWDRTNAWLQLLPSASFTSRLMRIDDRTFAERDFRRYLPPELRDQIPQTVFQTSYYSSIEVTAPLFNAAVLNNLYLAKAGHHRAASLETSARQQLIFQVVSTYLGVLKSHKVLALQEGFLELGQRNYEKAQRLYEAGRYSRTEAMRWQVDWEQQKTTVASSRGLVRSQETMLKRLLDMEMNAAVTLAEAIPATLTREAEALAALSEEELLQLINVSDAELVRINAALTAARAAMETGRYLYRSSYASYLPAVSASYSYGWRENDTPELDDYSPTTLMLNLSVPLFTSFKNLSSLKSAQYAFKQGQEQFKDQIKNTRYLLTEAVNRVITLKTQRVLAETTARFNEDNYRIVEQQKEKGLVSNIDFVDAKLNVQNARLNAVHTHYDFMAAVVELYFYLGRIDQLR